MENINDYISKYKTMTVSRGGPNCEITELRAKTAAMLGKDIGQVCALTKGWTKDELYEMYRKAQDGKIPAKLWWWLRKEFNKKYGEKVKKRIHDRVLSRVRKESRRPKQEEGQGILF